MHGLMRRLAALEATHADRTRLAPIGVALCPLLPGEPYSVTVPESGELLEFSTEDELFAFLDQRGPWDGLLLTPGLRSEEDWLAAAGS